MRNISITTTPAKIIMTAASFAIIAVSAIGMIPKASASELYPADNRVIQVSADDGNEYIIHADSSSHIDGAVAVTDKTDPSIDGAFIFADGNVLVELADGDTVTGTAK